MIEAAADVFGEGPLAHHLCQVEQKIVVIEHVLALLGFNIAGEQFSEFVGPAGAPRKRRAQHLLDWHLGIHAAGINGKTGGLGRKACLCLREAAFVSHEIYQVSGILSIMDREGPIKADLVGVFAQETRADGVKRARPGQRAPAMMPAFWPVTCPEICSTRRIISAAARRENVKSRIRHGSVPAERRKRLDTLRTLEGVPIPPNILDEMRRDLARLAVIREQIAAIERTRLERLNQTPGHRPHAMVQLLARVVGVGIETADMLVQEVLSRNLRDRRAVARYAGLTGSPDESGSKRREKGLTKSGNSRVRRGRIQLAWRFLMFQKDSALAQWFRSRTEGPKGARKTTMIVALARKLLIALAHGHVRGSPARCRAAPGGLTGRTEERILQIWCPSCDGRR